MKTIYKKLLFLLLLIPFSALAQNTLTGRVLETASGQPLPGVNVVVQGTTNGTSTDLDGNFTLTNVKNGDNIVFTYIGFRETAVAYTGQKTVSVSLEEDANLLSEVVVQVGYGTVRRRDVTGSITTVTERDFNRGAIVSVDQLLTGKAAGVRITNSGGNPDAAPNIRIRGGASLNANNAPLIVIDGVPIDNTNPAGVANPFSLINPNDIESITILKDASASAIYGSRASNGVIIIVSKRGSSGKAQFNYSSYVSAGNVDKKIDMMNGNEFVDFIQQYHPTYTNFLGIDDPGTIDTDDLSTDEIEGRIISNTDWQDAIYRTAITTDHNFSARANLYKKIPFRASVGYTRAEGLVKTNDYERFSYSLKMTPTMLDNHLRIDLNAKGIVTDKNNVDEAGAIGGAVRMDPTKPIYDNSPGNRFGGYYQNLTPNTFTLDGAWNPLAILEQRNRPERVLRFLGNVELDYKMHFLPELRAVVNLGLDASRAKIRETYGDNSIATYQIDGTNTDPLTNYVFNPGVNYLEGQHMTNTTWDSYLVYAKELAGFVSKFDVQGGYSYQNFKNDGHKAIYRYNDDTGIREESVDPANLNNRYYNELNLQSFFGRANIDLSDRYLITLSFRADATSLFAEDERWGYFPAAALAWKVKEETFLKSVTMVNDLKVRIGAGKTGQQDITGNVGFYPSTPLFDTGGNNSQYLEGVNLYAALNFNPDLTWEKTTTYNLGLDFDFFKNNILAGSFDIYQRETTDLLARVPLPPGQGLGDSFVKNVGETSSKGFELNVNLKPITTENTGLQFNANLAYNRTEVTDLDDVTTISASESVIRAQTRLAYHTVGQQPYSAWVFEQLYGADGNPIVGSYVDRNGDNEINNDDRYYKALRPNWTFGFGMNFNYRKWDFSTSFRGQLGGQVYNQIRQSNGYTDAAIPTNTTSLTNVLDFNSGAANPAFGSIMGNALFSDYFLEDASFLRCENIVVGYKFEKLIKTSSLRVYAAVNNAFIVTKYDGQDPENFNAIDNNFYPRPRMYTFGVSVDF
ncbi:MAG TPA: SusC/RagA family TonB-linked outer membrane protein [Flavobacterium sp.]|jgi:iron complex outermembrane receptor protein